MEKRLFEKAGIYGIEPYNEVFILSSFLLGDPCMLIGRHGSGKTELIKIIGQALNSFDRRENKDKPFSFQIYDASKLSFEDLVGYPDPKKLMEGSSVDFIRTPLTIWGKDLVGFDEANRTSPEVQNNLLEIIRSRKCNGLETGVKFIYATMNPFGSIATTDMSEALVDRFTFFLKFCDFDLMNDSVRSSIIERIGDMDSVGLRVWQKGFKGNLDFTQKEVNTDLADLGDVLTKILSDAGDIFPRIKEELGSSFNVLINKVTDSLITKFKESKPEIQDDIKLSGRRAGMIWRALIASRAIQMSLSKNVKYKLGNIEPLLKQTIISCIPLGVSRGCKKEDIAKMHDVVCSTVDNTWSLICKNSENLEIMHKLFNSPDYIERLNILLQKKIELEDLTERSAWTNLLESNQHITHIIQDIMTVHPSIIPSHIKLETNNNRFIDQERKIVLDPHAEEWYDEINEIREKCSSTTLFSSLYNELLCMYESLENPQIIGSLVKSFKQLHLFLLNLETKNTSETDELDFMKDIEEKNSTKNII